MLVTGRARRRGGGETHDNAAVELLHSGWLKERGQEFPVAPAAAPPGPHRLPAESTNFLPPPLHRFDPALPLATRPPWFPVPVLGLTPAELGLPPPPLTEGPSPELPPVLLPAK